MCKLHHFNIVRQYKSGFGKFSFTWAYQSLNEVSVNIHIYFSVKELQSVLDYPLPPPPPATAPASTKRMNRHLMNWMVNTDEMAPLKDEAKKS
jgi:hypothetical protein